MSKRKAARRGVELHRRHAEVEHHAVDRLGREPVADPEVRVDVAPRGRDLLQLGAQLAVANGGVAFKADVTDQAATAPVHSAACCSRYSIVERTIVATPDVTRDGLVDLVTFDETGAAEIRPGLADGRFLVLPHPEVAEFERRRAADRDRWLAGMRRLRRRLGPPGASS